VTEKSQSIVAKYQASSYGKWIEECMSLKVKDAALKIWIEQINRIHTQEEINAIEA
jgi:hypothetical protein